MSAIKEIAWLAGLLEGEASFSMKWNTPRIQLAMTDRDVVERAAVLLEGNVKLKQRKDAQPQHKQQYTVEVAGPKAVQWLMTLYTFMGERRQEKFRELLETWRAAPNNSRNKPYCIKGHALTPDNCYRRGHSWRRCRTCHLDYMQRKAERAKLSAIKNNDERVAAETSESGIGFRSTQLV